MSSWQGMELWCVIWIACLTGLRNTWDISEHVGHLGMAVRCSQRELTKGKNFLGCRQHHPTGWGSGLSERRKDLRGQPPLSAS